MQDQEPDDFVAVQPHGVVHWCVSFLEPWSTASVLPGQPCPPAPAAQGFPQASAAVEADSSVVLPGAGREELLVLTLSLALRSASQAMRCSPQS